MIEALNSVYETIKAGVVTTAAQVDNFNTDMKGHSYLELVFNFEIEIDTDGVGPTIAISDSDDTITTNAVTLVAARTAETLVSAKMMRYSIPWGASRKRFCHVKVTTATSTDDLITYSCTAQKSRSEANPATLAALVAGTNAVHVEIL